KDMQLARRLR
nr:Chain X, 10-mer peptide from Histone H3.1/H3.2 [synthetic construct]